MWGLELICFLHVKLKKEKTIFKVLPMTTGSYDESNRII